MFVFLCVPQVESLKKVSGEYAFHLWLAISQLTFKCRLLSNSTTFTDSTFARDARITAIFNIIRLIITAGVLMVCVRCCLYSLSLFSFY